MKKRPIAMKCNQEQFEAIKPKLERLYRVKVVRPKGHRIYSYLTNNHLGVDILVGMTNDIKNREIHETWNEQIFLEACGVEVEKPKTVFEISKEQISIIHNLSSLEGKKFIKSNFPQVFEEEKKEVVLENDFTGWAKSNEIGNEAWTMYFENGCLKYGIDSNGMWFLPKGIAYVRSDYRKANPQEVEDALINESKKRYKEGDWFKCFNQDEFIKLDTGFKTVFIETEGFWHGGGIVMKNGIWATVTEKQIQHNGLTYVLKN